MDIEVGEYVRTKDGIIAKVTYKDVLMIDTDRDVFDIRNMPMMEIPTEFIDEYVVKHSKNIIDLIEVGDFVGNCEIQYIHKNEKGETLLENDDVTLTEKDIKTIVTKEQYKSIEYKVEE